MLLAPLGFFIAMEAVFIPYEEQRLDAAFGAAYESYEIKTRRREAVAEKAVGCFNQG